MLNLKISDIYCLEFKILHPLYEHDILVLGKNDIFKLDVRLFMTTEARMIDRFFTNFCNQKLQQIESAGKLVLAIKL